jgi:hypothetical protein
MFLGPQERAKSIPSLTTVIYSTSQFTEPLTSTSPIIGIPHTPPPPPEPLNTITSTTSPSPHPVAVAPTLV